MIFIFFASFWGCGGSSVQVFYFKRSSRRLAAYATLAAAKRRAREGVPYWTKLAKGGGLPDFKPMKKQEKKKESVACFKCSMLLRTFCFSFASVCRCSVRVHSLWLVASLAVAELRVYCLHRVYI